MLGIVTYFLCSVSLLSVLKRDSLYRYYLSAIAAIGLVTSVIYLLSASNAISDRIADFLEIVMRNVGVFARGPDTFPVALVVVWYVSLTGLAALAVAAIALGRRIRGSGGVPS
jgi:hypothetical protein